MAITWGTGGVFASIGKAVKEANADSVEPSTILGSAVSFIRNYIQYNFRYLGGITYTTFADLSQKPEVCQLISGEVKNLNAKLPGGQGIHRFINMPKELDPDEAELTRTMKLRRRLVEERYQDFIAALYGEKEKVSMDVPVFYRDGRRAVVKAEITVSQVN